MNTKIFEIEQLINNNKALTFQSIDVKKSNDVFYLLNDKQHITLIENNNLYSITFLYNIQDIVKKNNFDDFLSELCPEVIIKSEYVIDAIRLFHRTVTENLDKLAIFTNNGNKGDDCKGSVSIILDKTTNRFHSLVMTGLLSCVFVDNTSCFYNIKYTYTNNDELCFILAKNMISKTLTKFSNNGFICLMDFKMSDAFADIYVNYTAEELKNIKTLHSMISI